MAAGYDYAFVDVVGKEFKCKKCSLVACKATLTDCCGETFCEGCITSAIEQKEPCPHCREKKFHHFNQVKHQHHIAGLQVFCRRKERGCDWRGRLDQLDTHLDPDLDHCQYVDSDCPLNCGTQVAKNELEDHVLNKCLKREHFCRYCSHKASFEEIEDQHIDVCEYVPLQCPNRCGVTCEREHMEGHLKTCPLQEISCEFSSVGCKEEFKREDQEKHNKENIQQHLSLVLECHRKTEDEKLEAQRKKLEAQEKKLEAQEKKLEAQEKKLEAQEKKLEAQEKKLEAEKLEAQKKKLEAQEKKLEAQEKKLEAQEKKLEAQEKKLEAQEKKIEAQEKKLAYQQAEYEKNVQDFRTLKNENNTKIEELAGRIQLDKEDTKTELKRANDKIAALLKTILFTSSVIIAVGLCQVFSHNHPIIEDKIISLENVIQELSNNNSYLRKIIQEQRNSVIHLEEEIKRLNRTARLFPIFTNEFILTEFSVKRSAGGVWTSPAMYTHVDGYKFEFHINFLYRISIAHVQFQAIAGEFDGDLSWPAKVHFSTQLINPDSMDRSTRIEKNFSWDVKNNNFERHFFRFFVDTNKFLFNDSLWFEVTSVVFLAVVP